MPGRLTILLVVLGTSMLVAAGYALYRRGGRVADRLDIGDLGLELMTGCCAFVVFTTPTCRPCKAALRVVTEAAARGTAGTEVVKIDATEHPEMAARYDIRSVPTTFFITASGHVLHRWRDVPDPDEVQIAMNAL